MRGRMQQLWESLASGEATVAQMILYPNAAALSKLEIPELLSLLPVLEKKDILELGAGIGQVLYAVFYCVGQTIALFYFLDSYVK